MLLFENKVKVNTAAFITKVRYIASLLKINPNWLMFIMNFESAGTFSPAIKNKYSGGTGLIQFMPSTAKTLGTTTAALALMSNLEQLDYVYKYFKNSHYNSIYDLYLWTFYPYAKNQPDSYIIGSEKGMNYARLVKTQNPGIGIKEKDVCTLGEWKDSLTVFIKKLLPTTYEAEFNLKKKD